MRNKTVSIDIDMNPGTVTYFLRGITVDDFEVLKADFTKATYKDYDGTYAPLFPYPELAVLIHLFEKYKATKHDRYTELFHIGCEESPVYILNDGRIARTGPFYCVVYPSESDYIMACHNTSNILAKKKIPKGDYPIKRIDYLSKGKKIFSQEIDPFIGNLLVKVLPVIEHHPPMARPTSASYRVSKNSILVYDPSYKTYKLYQKNDFEVLQKNDNAPYMAYSIWRRNYFEKDFINHIDPLINSLPELLNAPPHLFDYSKQYLNSIEKYTFYNLITDEFSDAVFLPLLAYFGQTIVEINKEYNAMWTVTYNKPYDAWIPDVTINGHFMEIWRPVYEILNTRDAYLDGGFGVLRRFLN